MPRPRLTARVDLALRVPLTLISAPAGFGKTTLLVEWASSLAPRLAWLTVDPGDRDLPRFVAHVIAALAPVVPSLDGDEVLAALQRPNATNANDIGSALAEALLDLPDDVLLVIDDYHLAASVEVENVVASLLYFMPPAFHLVLATRNDPSLPLARMRLQGQIVEIRGDELRFTDDEARLLLATSQREADDPALAMMLRHTTGGWAAGLRLASLALPTGDDPTRIAEAVTGDQHLMDFLVEEVLAKQSDEVQDFLLRTAIVDRVSAPLADALLDRAPQGGSWTLLTTLARERVFFEAEGVDGVWYRHHPLFHSLLRHQLESRLSASAIQSLHARASIWMAAQGLIEEAIRHRLVAGDPGAAAALVEQHVQTALDKEDWPSLATWLDLLPAAMIEETPSLLLARAWVSYLSGRLEPVLETLNEVRALLDREGSDPATSAALRSECDALVLIQLLTIAQDPHAAIDNAREAVTRIPADHRFGRGLAYFCYGIGLQAAGETERAVRWLTGVAEREADRIDAGSIRALLGLVFVHRQAGNFGECRKVASDMLALAERHGLPVTAGWAHLVLGRLAYEANDLETAIVHLESIVANWQRLHLSCVTEGMWALTLAYQAKGRILDADATLRQLTDIILDFHAVALLSALRLFEARLALRQGNREQDLAAVNMFDVTIEGNTLVMFEHEIINRVHLLLAAASEEHLALAWRDVEQLLAAAEAGHHDARAAEILALAALVREAQGHHEAALTYLRRSVTVGEAVGFCRTYVDLGPAIVPLLDQLASQGVQTPYLQRLLAIIKAEVPGDRQAQGPIATATSVHVLELLTVREAEVLDGLCRRLSYQEIAQELFISVHTVKSHTMHIYEKLGVANRRQALAMADALGLTAGHLSARLA